MGEEDGDRCAKRRARKGLLRVLTETDRHVPNCSSTRHCVLMVPCPHASRKDRRARHSLQKHHIGCHGGASPTAGSSQNDGPRHAKRSQNGGHDDYYPSKERLSPAGAHESLSFTYCCTAAQLLPRRRSRSSLSSYFPPAKAANTDLGKTPQNDALRRPQHPSPSHADPRCSASVVVHPVSSGGTWA